MQTYRYASDASGEVADVTTLDRSCKRSAFSCLSCGGPMVARLGLIRDRCFAHLAVGNCSSESYLHILGKFFFSQTFKACLSDGRPFWVGRHRRVAYNVYVGEYFAGTTLPRTADERIDLCLVYDDVQLEQGIGGFIADLILRDTRGRKKPTCIEIKVTHGMTEEKRRSGLQIVEVSVASEVGLTPIRSGDIPTAAAEWVGFSDAPRVSRAEATVYDLITHFGQGVLQPVVLSGRPGTVGIHWFTHRAEYFAVRDDVIISWGPTLEEVATAAGVPLTPIEASPALSEARIPSESYRGVRAGSKAQVPTRFLDEVLAVFGGQILDEGESGEADDDGSKH